MLEIIRPCQEPCVMSNDATVECCCWTSGTVTATLKLNRRCFVPGETILINAEIANNSQTDITSTRASLKQVRKFLDACVCYESYNAEQP